MSDISQSRRILCVSDNVGTPFHARGILNYTAGILESLADLQATVTLLVEQRRSYGMRQATLDQLPVRAAKVVEIAEIYRFLGDADPTPPMSRNARSRRAVDLLRRTFNTAARRHEPPARLIANEPGLIDFTPYGLRHLGHVDRFMVQPDIYDRSTARARKNLSPPMIDARGHDLIFMDAPHYFAFQTDPGAKVVLVIHDLIPLTDPHMHAKARTIFIRKLQCSLNAATHLAFVSEATRAQFAALFPAHESRLPFLLIPPTLRATAIERARLRDARAPASATPTFVAIVSDEPRKNIGALVAAFMELGQVANLVIVGHVDKGRYMPLFDDTNRHIQFAGFICDNEKYALLRSATGVILASHSEGFGIPAMEGALFGAPVLCADIPVFHEITGGLASFFDPHRPDDLARLVEDVIADPEAFAAKADKMRRFCLDNYAPASMHRRMAEMLGNAPASAAEEKHVACVSAIAV